MYPFPSHFCHILTFLDAPDFFYPNQTPMISLPLHQTCHLFCHFAKLSITDRSPFITSVTFYLCRYSQPHSCISGCSLSIFKAVLRFSQWRKRTCTTNVINYSIHFDRLIFQVKQINHYFTDNSFYPGGRGSGGVLCVEYLIICHIPNWLHHLFWCTMQHTFCKNRRYSGLTSINKA